MKRKHPRRLRAAPGGFTLIEVLVAIVVLAFGLLGFALLQTMSVRFTQSANYRTQATNLAYDLIDQMRANRYQAAWYSTASFSPGTVAVAGAWPRHWARPPVPTWPTKMAASPSRSLGVTSAGTRTNPMKRPPSP
jgi:type IV pilus assembly protein PilV